MGREEHTRAGLLDKLASDGHATKVQVADAERFLDFYAERGLIRCDSAQPLYCACPCAPDCWGDIPPIDWPPTEEAEIAVPWVGPDYHDTRVCGVAINFNNAGSLGAHWWIARAEIEDYLARGKRRRFGFPTGRYLGAVMMALDGSVPDAGALDTAIAARGWKGAAFVEAVKCAPIADLSAPPEAMWRNCPPRYLANELELLRPRVVVAIGQRVWDVVREVGDVELVEQQQSFQRGTGRLNGEPIELLCVNHPSHGNSRHSLPPLLDSLRQRPPG